MYNMYNKYHYILYILLFILIVILIAAAYIKMRFRFWTLQPVFHIYDFHYYLFPPGIINPELPEKNKYCNFKAIETVKYDALSEIRMNKFVKFIRKHYLRNNANCYNPQKNNIMPYFEGHNTVSFFSFYYEDELLVSLKKGTTETSPSRKIVGVMTTRPLKVEINNGNKDAFFDVYYVDHLCVDTMYRKQGIAPQIIQTHHYNQRRHNREITVSLFKRENELTGIIPLCVYTTYGFEMAGWLKPVDLMAHTVLVQCGKTNIHYLFDFMRENNPTKFDICIMPEISNIMELIRTNNIYVYMIIQADEVKCAYFFRKSCTFIREGCEAVCCFASINGFSKREREKEKKRKREKKREGERENEIFIHGYKVALWKICEKHGFTFSVIEEISDNCIVVDALKKKSVPVIASPTAYFFYNFAYHTFQPSRTLIIQ